MTSGFPSFSGPSPLGPPGGSPFGPSSVLFGFEVPQGSPGDLDALASGMRSAGGWFGDLNTRVQTSGRVAVEASSGWQGQAASGFSTLAGHLSQTLSGNALACENAARALSRLSQALSHAQHVTSQALSDCERLNGEVTRQQQAANDAGGRAGGYEQALADPMTHPAAIPELQHQASLERGTQRTAQAAANSAQGELDHAERRGKDAYRQYELDAQALANTIQGAAGQIRPTDAIAGLAAAQLAGAPGAGSLGPAFGFAVAAAVTNPLESMPFDPYQPGSLLYSISESRYRSYVEKAVDGGSAATAVYAADRSLILRKQLTANARRLIQLDQDIETVGPASPEAAVIGALRTGVASESASIAQAARGMRGTSSFLESKLPPVLLGLTFLANVAEGKNLTEATASTTFSFTFAFAGMRGAAAVCPVRTPVSEAVCAAAGAVAGGFGGQAAADKLAGAEDAVNRQLADAFKALSTPVGGGGILSGVTPIMAGGTP